MYKLIENSKGNRWMKDGKFVAESSVPINDKKNLTGECLFCDHQGSENKLLNGSTIALCLEHYNNQTTGAIAQRIREG